MTTNDAQASSVGASSPDARMWEQADWPQIEAQVKRLQMRIAKAVREGRWGKAKALQRLLTRSHSGKMLAVKRVTENRGKRTPGVDGKVWLTPASRWKGTLSLRHRGYRTMPAAGLYSQEQWKEASAGNPLHAVPGDAGFMEARSGTYCGDPGRPEFLRLPAGALDRRRHRTVFQLPVASYVGRVGSGRRHSRLFRQLQPFLAPGAHTDG